MSETVTDLINARLRTKPRLKTELWGYGPNFGVKSK